MDFKKSANLSNALGSSKGRKALGKGLGALIPTASRRAYFECELDRIKPEKAQPRRNFDLESLQELAESILASGLIQPLIVREDGADFRLIAGERRWRASRLAGLKTVPVVIKDVDKDEAFELALVENIQRQDLNPLEEAQAYQRLMELRAYTQEELAKRLGRSRPSIANTLRLLKLNQFVQDAIIGGDLSEGAARALLSLPTEAYQIELAKRSVAEGFSVRRIEAICRKVKQNKLELDAAINAVVGGAAQAQISDVQDTLAQPNTDDAPALETVTETSPSIEVVSSSEQTAVSEQTQTTSAATSVPAQSSDVETATIKALLEQLQESMELRPTILQESGGRGVLKLRFENTHQLKTLLERLCRTV